MSEDILGAPSDILSGLQETLNSKADKSSVDATLADTASINELAATAFHTGDTTTNTTRPLFTAPFALKMKSLALVLTGNNSGDGTNRWRFFLGKWDANLNYTTIAVKSNWPADPSGGANILANVPFTFDSISFNNVLINPGELAVVSWTPVGTPVALTNRYWTFRFEPV